MKICVLSDVHYKYRQETPADQENAVIFLSFLEGIVGKYDLLVLNGDIFDLYNDWKYTIVRQYFPVLHRLANIREAGCRIVYISGNHDFWFNGFLDRELGFELYSDQYAMTADGRKLLFTHGDLYTVNDLRYKLFRRFIRMSAIRLAFDLLHPDLALTIGAAMSRSSRLRKVSDVLKRRKGNGLKTWARAQITKNKADIVIMGHNHDPEIIPIGEGCYANAGDWLKNYSYLEITDGIIELKYNKEKAE